jgi:hypothetical protein
LLLGGLCVIEELLVSPVEVGIGVPVLGDGRSAVGRLGVADSVDGGEVVAGEVGVLAAGGDAGAAGDVRAVGGGEEFDGARLDGFGEFTHALVVRCAGNDRRRRLRVLDGSLELVELAGELWLVLAGGLVGVLSIGELVAVLVDRLADRVPGGRRDPLHECGGEQAGWMTAGGVCISGKEPLVMVGMSTPV